MALKDYKYSFIILALTFSYFIFFHQGNDGKNSKFQVNTDTVVFHSNWTKSLDDLCCLGKLHDALSLPGIQNLDVSFSMSSFNEEELRNIFAVTKFQSYKNIKLDLSGLNISNTGIQFIAGLIQPSVEHLQLNLNGISTQPGFGKLFAQQLNTFINLKSLKISLIMSIKNTEVNDFILSHRPSTSLDVFHLILIGNEITKDGLVNLPEYLTKVELEELHLNLYANKLGIPGAEIVSNAIRNQQKLQSLALDLYFNNITEIGTENVTAVLQTLQTLKSLELNLDFNYIKNEGGKALGKMLQKMTNLESLNLGVASKNFGYLGFKYVISGLQKLTQLKKLVLRCGVNRVGINGAEITKEMLAGMTNLEHLEIGFIQNYVGDDGIALIAEQVASMTKLKNVYLNLAFNDAKSYGLIKTLKSFLNNKYNSLHLSLSSNEFRDNDVKLIESQLPKLISNNEEFIFDFTDTAISKKEAAKLESVFHQSNRKFNRNAKISVNSIIPEEEQKPKEQAKQPEPKKQAPQKQTEKPASTQQAPSNKTNEL